jgi:hypothetical protein
MDQNSLVALTSAVLGVSDIVVARWLGDRISPQGRAVLTYGGYAFLALAALFALRIVRL